MAQLGCEQEAQIKNAGLCLAALAFVELPKGQWPEFLHFMTQNSQNENYHHRLAVVMTLGIFSELQQDDESSTLQ